MEYQAVFNQESNEVIANKIICNQCSLELFCTYEHSSDHKICLQIKKQVHIWLGTKNGKPVFYRFTLARSGINQHMFEEANNIRI